MKEAVSIEQIKSSDDKFNVNYKMSNEKWKIWLKMYNDKSSEYQTNLKKIQ